MTALHRWTQEVTLEAKRIQYPNTLSEKVYHPPYFVDLEAKLSKLEHTRRINGKNIRFDLIQRL